MHQTPLHWFQSRLACYLFVSGWAARSAPHCLAASAIEQHHTSGCFDARCSCSISCNDNPVNSLIVASGTLDFNNFGLFPLNCVLQPFSLHFEWRLPRQAVSSPSFAPAPCIRLKRLFPCILLAFCTQYPPHLLCFPIPPAPVRSRPAIF